MPFRLCNVPASFQDYINRPLLDYLDVFYTAFLDGMLIYSNRKEDHAVHVLRILQHLRPPTCLETRTREAGDHCRGD